jgi:hypothetical protein
MNNPTTKSDFVENLLINFTTILAGEFACLNLCTLI